MPKNHKSELYNLLKETGAPLTTSYVRYTTAQLEAELTAVGVDIPASLEESRQPEPVQEVGPPFFHWRSIPFLSKLLPSR